MFLALNEFLNDWKRVEMVGKECIFNRRKKIKLIHYEICMGVSDCVLH